MATMADIVGSQPLHRPSSFSNVGALEKFVSSRPKDFLKWPRQFFIGAQYVDPGNAALASGAKGFRHAVNFFNFPDTIKEFGKTYNGIKKGYSAGYIAEHAGLTLGYGSKSTLLLHQAGVINAGSAAPYLGPIQDVTTIGASLRELTWDQEYMSQARELEGIGTSPKERKFVDLAKKTILSSTVYNVTLVALCTFALLGFFGVMTICPFMMFTISTLAVVATTSKFFRKHEALHTLKEVNFHEHNGPLMTALRDRRWTSIV